MKESIWNEVDAFTAEFKTLGIADTLDYSRFSNYSLVHHSSTIEGSTLTEVESQVLLADGLTAKGKPLVHSLMVKDHYQALLYILEKANAKETLSVSFIQKIGALIMATTGGPVNALAGNYDTSKGELRRGNVFAGDFYFMNYDKVENALRTLCNELNTRLAKVSLTKDVHCLAFDAHFNVVSIHPFGDGNGRVSRLVMNFLQHYFAEPMTIIYSEDKSDYIQALIETRKAEDINVFRNFMAQCHVKYLRTEIEKYKNMQRGTYLTFNN